MSEKEVRGWVEEEVRGGCEGGERCVGEVVRFWC